MKSQLTSLGNGLLSATTVMRRITSLGGGLLLLAAFGSTACQDSNAPESQDTENIGDNEFGVNFEALGFNHPTCTGADTLASPPVYVASTKTLNLALVPSNDAIVSVVGGKIKVNGYLCKTLPVQAGAISATSAAVAAIELTSTNVNKINITANSTNKVVIDLLPGTFGNIFSAATSGIVINGNNIAVGVRGTATANLVKMGEEALSGSTRAYYFELSGDAKPDL